mmetsp:Transcript_18129/g.46426  ORF Transcript_18129/g.46426 Transcript_18129/m.46426 type:complete len:248 (-) Transcript_18129:1059-1802(-)
MVHHVEQEPPIVDLVDHRAAARARLVEGGPLRAPQLEGLALPQHERLRVDHRRLHDLLAREDAPRDGAHARRHSALVRVLRHVVPALAAHIERLVVQRGVAAHRVDDGVERLRRDEHLRVRLLVHVPTRSAPAHVGVVRGRAVDRGLRVDGEHPPLVDERELLDQARRLVRKRQLAPWEHRDLATHVPHEGVAHVACRVQLVAPCGAALGGLERVQLCGVMVRQLAERRARAVAPAPVGELVPVRGA